MLSVGVFSEIKRDSPTWQNAYLSTMSFKVFFSVYPNLMIKLLIIQSLKYIANSSDLQKSRFLSIEFSTISHKTILIITNRFSIGHFKTTFLWLSLMSVTVAIILTKWTALNVGENVKRTTENRLLLMHCRLYTLMLLHRNYAETKLLLVLKKE